MNKRTDNRGVAQRFAQREEATNSNGQYFSTGDVLYSYGRHWPIAAWIMNDATGRIQLHINNAKYGTTTSKQTSYMVSGMVKEGRADYLTEAVKHDSVESIKAAMKKAGLGG